MKVIGNFLKDLFLGKKIVTVAQPRLGHTPKEVIVFPETYKPVILYSNIPDRQESLPSGSLFGSNILNLSAQQRDDAIFAQCMSGNIPNWMRNFKPITVTDNFGNALTYFVSPDVLCIGNEYDFLRVSLNGYTARRVVDAFGCMLPTRRMSDQIWQHADLKMMPTGMGASYHMASTKTLMDHNAVIEKQRAGRNFNVITGHKKDIVYTKHLLVDKTRLAIYGWHYPNGRALQGPMPNSTSHNVWYQDYSSSIRLISQKAILNQQVVNLYDILNDKRFAHLISDEGSLDARSMYKS